MRETSKTRQKDRHSFRARSPSPQPPSSSRQKVTVKTTKSKKSRSKSIDARRKDTENRCVVFTTADLSVDHSSSRVWARTSSAPSSTCCEEELKVWNNFRKRLTSNQADVSNERIEHMRGLESRINVINDKGCCLYQATRSSKLVEATHKKPDMKTASLGRRTRAGQHHRDPHQSIDCESRGPLIECIRILNRLTTELHAEASCIRTEISEIHDSFGEQHAEQNDVKKELFEMSKYVRILEHRLKQAQTRESKELENDRKCRLKNELERLKEQNEKDQKENRELYLQIISLRNSERALKEENKRLHNKLDQLSLHGTQIDSSAESACGSADEELEKETNLLKTEIMLMKKSLTEVTKLNTNLKEKIYQYQVKYGEEISISVSDDDFSQPKSKSSLATNGVFEFDSNDDEFIEEEMLILQSTIKELEMENARLKQISSYEENVSMRKELARLRTENANLRSGVQTKIQLKSALRSTLAPDKSLRSTMSERSFIVRRGIFELLPVLSVREEVYRVQRLSNKLLSALRKQQKIEISFTAVSAEARALAAETALLVKKYSVLEEQVQTLIDELKQTQRLSPTRMILNKSSDNNNIDAEIF